MVLHGKSSAHTSSAQMRDRIQDNERSSLWASTQSREEFDETSVARSCKAVLPGRMSHMLGLKRTLIPMDAEPLELADQSLLRLTSRACQVRVLNPVAITRH